MSFHVHFVNFSCTCYKSSEKCIK